MSRGGVDENGRRHGRLQAGHCFATVALDVREAVNKDRVEFRFESTGRVIIVKDYIFRTLRRVNE